VLHGKCTFKSNCTFALYFGNFKEENLCDSYYQFNGLQRGLKERVLYITQWVRTVMIVMGSVILQDSMDLLEVTHRSCSEICTTSSHDVNEITDIKVEEASDTQEVEDPLLITLPVIKDDHEVSCMSVSAFTDIENFILS
jgi:hypothetical protein